MNTNQTIKLMTWNTLSRSDFYCSNFSFPKAASENLDWNNRAKLFKNIFNEQNPDLICLQEVDDYEEFKTNILEKYDSAYFKKEDGVQGIAFFYQKIKFSLLHLEKVALPSNEQGDLSNQFFLFLFIKDTQTEQVVCVISTHLKAKSHNESYRNAQVKYMLNFIDNNENFVNMYTTLNARAVIICGDFNAEPSYSCIQFLGDFEFTNNPNLLNKKLISAYNFDDSSKEDYIEMTTFKYRDTAYYRVIDYIFYTDGIEFISNSPTIKKSDQKFLEIKDVGYPSACFPSDHFYLTLQFKF